MRDLRVMGQVADGHAFVEAMRPLIGDAAADRLRTFAAEGGGGGASFALPAGLGDGVCPTTPAPPTASPETGGAVPAADDGANVHRAGAASPSPALPATGGSAPVAFAGIAAVAALAMRRLTQRWS
jgi:hypothetical protein